MPSTPTPRLGLTAPAGGDAVVLYPSLMQADLNTLDNAVTFTKGTISARPAAALAGRRYYATDTGLYYEDNGATWQTLQFAPQDTGWLVLTSPPTGVLINGGAGRLVGDAIRFEGHITNSSGSSIAAGTTLATVPTAVRPVGVRVMAGALGSSGGVPSAPVSVSVSASGPLSMSASLPNGMDLILDGGVIYVP